MTESPRDSGGANGVAGGSEHVNGGSGVPLRLKSRRKQSSPMMPPFMVSAPGKVIMFGEHAVVHGKVSFYPPSPGPTASLVDSANLHFPIALLKPSRKALLAVPGRRDDY
jgi:hypothetical protein